MDKNLKLYCFQTETGERRYFPFYNEENFLNALANEYVNVRDDDKYTVEYMLKYFEECPYIHYYEVDDEEDILDLDEEVEIDYKKVKVISSEYNNFQIKAGDLLSLAEYEGQELGWCY